MKNLVLGLVLVASGAWAAAADEVKADDLNAGQPWSAIGPKTVAPGGNVVEGSVGYPSISVSYLRGFSPGFNLGVRVGFVYGVEGMFRESAPGFKGQLLLKLRLLDAGRVSVGLTFEPGVFSYSSFLQGGRLGVALPVGVRLGIAASSALSVAVLVEFPMWIEFGQFGGFNFPILTGGGAEYFITSQFAVFARARIGPTIRTNRPAEVTFDASLGVGYRF